MKLDLNGNAFAPNGKGYITYHKGCTDGDLNKLLASGANF